MARKTSIKLEKIAGARRGKEEQRGAAPSGGSLGVEEWGGGASRVRGVGGGGPIRSEITLGVKVARSYVPSTNWLHVRTRARAVYSHLVLSRHCAHNRRRLSCCWCFASYTARDPRPR